jgi:threonine dehydrogenase-like Zn-dependent dehydrogenase
VTGAGAVGLLAAMMGRQRGYEVDVLDRNTAGPKSAMVAALGGRYHACNISELPDFEFDTVMECTGAQAVIAELMLHAGHNTVVCLAGLGAASPTSFDIGASNRTMVMNNATVFGTVNASRDHYIQAVEALQRADRDWLTRMISRRVDIERFADAFTRRSDDIKVVLTFGEHDATH